MTLQPGLQTIIIHILSNLLQTEGNQTMKFGQLAEYIKEIIFVKNHAENVAERLQSQTKYLEQNEVIQ